MKAAILEKYASDGRELIVRDIPIPAIADDEVLVKVVAAVLSVSVGWILSVLSAAETAFVVECSAASRIPALQPAVIAVTATIKMIATGCFK